MVYASHSVDKIGLSREPCAIQKQSSQIRRKSFSLGHDDRALLCSEDFDQQ